MLLRFLCALAAIAIFFTIDLTGTQAADAIRLSSAKPALIHLEEDASSVIVGNPVHASVTLDNPRMLMINAGIPGMTNIVVLGRNGQVIFDRAVISGSGSDDMVRIQNACVNGGDGCVANKMYYCAAGERCHDVAIPQMAQGRQDASGQRSQNIPDAEVPE